MINGKKEMSHIDITLSNKERVIKKLLMKRKNKYSVAKYSAESVRYWTVGPLFDFSAVEITLVTADLANQDFFVSLKPLRHSGNGAAIQGLFFAILPWPAVRKVRRNLQKGTLEKIAVESVT